MNDMQYITIMKEIDFESSNTLPENTSKKEPDYNYLILILIAIYLMNN